MQTQITVLPTADGDDIARENQGNLLIDRPSARELGRVAIEILERGEYFAGNRQVSIADSVLNSVAQTVSIPPGGPLPEPPGGENAATLTVSCANETSLSAAKRLLDAGTHPLVLNFANAIEPGGGFLSGSVAQEEYLARSSGLYATIKDDPMYRFHRDMGADSFLASEWAILSPGVPVFRGDIGWLLAEPWLCAMLTCAAPVARKVGLERATAVMQTRIDRVLSIARAYGYRSLVLGAWGCGAFHNDPAAIAGFFREALTGKFLGGFDEAVFAVTDWSPDRRYLGPFRDTFHELG
ncbi:MAG: TIGR02452 family protein [Akkermansiaceae bacterium]|nr:TIGR02452 family protein [Armatimonadota bacterium]